MSPTVEATTVPFGDVTTAALRDADRRLRFADGGFSSLAVTDSTLAKLALYESFYVGFYRGDREMVYPYVRDHGSSIGTDVHQFGEHGLSAWMRRERRMYRPAEDGGSMLRRGTSFGDKQEQSMDCVVVPLIDPQDDTVQGLLGVLSSAADRFDPEFVAAADWMGRRLAAVHFGGVPRGFYLDRPELDSTRQTTVIDRVRDLAIAVTELRTQIAGLQPPEGGPPEPIEQVTRLGEWVGESLAEIVLGLESADPPPAAPAPLTPREREIAQLIGSTGMTNAAIAAQLVLSEKTVKGHVSQILRKLGVPGRDDIAAALCGPETV